MKTIQKIKYGIPVAAATLVPFITFAQTATQGAPTAVQNTQLGLIGTVSAIQAVVNAVIPVLIALALALFLWGVLTLAFSKDESNRANARSLMLWGIIALFVMTAVWAFVNLLQETIFGAANQGTSPNIPSVGGVAS